MAALTATFEQTVTGNKRLVFASVAGGLGSSADSVVFPVQVISGGVNFVYTAGAGGATVAPLVVVSGTTVNIFNGTTGVAFVLDVTGR